MFCHDCHNVFLGFLPDYCMTVIFLDRLTSAFILVKCVCVGPLGSALTKLLGHRAVVMLGGVITCLGLVFTTFATKLYHLYITYGVLTGSSTKGEMVGILQSDQTKVVQNRETRHLFGRLCFSGLDERELISTISP